MLPFLDSVDTILLRRVCSSENILEIRYKIHYHYHSVWKFCRAIKIRGTAPAVEMLNVFEVEFHQINMYLLHKMFYYRVLPNETSLNGRIIPIYELSWATVNKFII